MSREDLYLEAPFAYRLTKSGLAQISYRGRVVRTLRGAKSSRFVNRIGVLDADAAQLEMAKLTGHFKHGNERASKLHRE